MKKVTQKDFFRWMYNYLINQPEEFFKDFDEPTAKAQILEILKQLHTQTLNWHESMKKDTLDDDIINVLQGTKRETAYTLQEIYEKSELIKQIGGEGVARGAITRLVKRGIVHKIPSPAIGTVGNPVKYFLEPDYKDKLKLYRKIEDE